jgi:Glutamate-ammonia ligase adenylyltransferase/GlnD PII-uridylyltransferase
MKTTNLSIIHQQLSLLALRLSYQNQITTSSLRSDLELLLQTLQLLYPNVSATEAQLSALVEGAFASKLSLAVQRFLFAGVLRAKEFLQLQQALSSLQQEPTLDALALHTHQVREILRSFSLKELSAFWSTYSPEVLALLVSQDDAERANALASLEVQNAAEFLPRLGLLPIHECSARWLQALSQSPDPESSLRWLLSLLEAPFGLSYYKFFGRHEAWMLSVLRLTGLTESLSRLLLRNLALAEEVFLKASLGGPKTQLKSIEVLRVWQKQEQLRIILAWLYKTLTLYDTQRQLSRLAEACVVRCFEEALVEDHAQHVSAAPRLAVIALGSLGANEMLHQSDVDLMFFSDGDPDAEERCTKIAQRTIALLTANRDEGSLYEVDTRLRPLGTQGPLVVSVQGWSRYFGLIESDSPHAHLWEEQALLRARTITGDAGLTAAFSALQQRVLRRPRVAQMIVDEVRHMRQKIEREVPRHRRFYYKASSGGLHDIDFLVQSLQLTHGDKRPELLCPTTHQSLTLLSGAGLLSIEDTALLLSAHEQWLTLTLLTRLLVEKNLDFIPEDSNALRRAFCESKNSSEDSFQKQLELLRVQVRACFDKVVH